MISEESKIEYYKYMEAHGYHKENENDNKNVTKLSEIGNEDKATIFCSDCSNAFYVPRHIGTIIATCPHCGSKYEIKRDYGGATVVHIRCG